MTATFRTSSSVACRAAMPHTARNELNNRDSPAIIDFDSIKGLSHLGSVYVTVDGELTTPAAAAAEGNPKARFHHPTP